MRFVPLRVVAGLSYVAGIAPKDESVCPCLMRLLPKLPDIRIAVIAAARNTALRAAVKVEQQAGPTSSSFFHKRPCNNTPCKHKQLLAPLQPYLVDPGAEPAT